MKRFTSCFRPGSGSIFLKKLVSAVFVIAMVSGLAAARHVEEREVVELGKPTRVEVFKNYTEFNSNQVSIVVPPSHEPTEVVGRDSEGEIECVYRETFGKEIVCNPGRPVSRNYSVTISYETPGVSVEKQKYQVFEHQKRILVPTRSYSLEVILPEGYGIISSEEDAFNPDYGRTGSEGRRIFVKWDANNASLGDVLNYRVRYQELNVFRNFFPNRVTMFSAVSVLLLAVIVAVYVKYMKSEDTIASVMPILKEDEKKVLRYLIEREGECEQKNLVQDLDYSKAKISRLVKDLEERNLIKKIKEGRKNRLVIKKAIGNISED